MDGNASLIRRWLTPVRGALLFVTTGCAQPAVTAAVNIPPVPQGEARIWYYRAYEPYAGKGLPAITTNGEYVGAAELGGAFYRDVHPGQYVVTVETTGVDVNQVARFDLALGQTAYVKIVSNPEWVSGGNRVEWERPTFYAWRIPNKIAQAAVAQLSFLGGS